MIPTAFREFDVETNDFPIRISVVTQQFLPPKVEPHLETTYVRRSDGQRQRVAVQGQIDPTTGHARFELPLPPGFSGAILFTILAAIPLAQKSPYEVFFLSADAQQAKDRIFPDVVTPVFANYAMDLK